MQIRYTPHDLRQIEVFRGDLWLCTAWPQGALTDEQRQAVLERRRADAAELGRRQQQASRRARARLAPITEPGTPEEVTVISAGQARTERWHRDRDGERDIQARDRDLQRLARTDLLNLHTDFDYWNPPRDRGIPPAGAEAGSRDDAGDGAEGGQGVSVRHFLDIGQAVVLPTAPLAMVDQAVADLVTRQAMGAVHGPAGLGKTFADLLLFVDDHFARQLRDGAAFTATAVDLCQATGADRLDEQITRNAFALTSSDYISTLRQRSSSQVPT